MCCTPATRTTAVGLRSGRGVRAGLAAGVALSVALFVGLSGAAAAGGTRGGVTPPVIAEDFTLLSCSHGSTIGMEGCAEHALVAADRRIDAEVRVLFRVLPDDAARSRLVAAETAWLRFRRADCESQSDLYEGGSLAPVAFVQCEVRDDASRSAGLRSFYRGLVQGRADPPAFP